MMRMVHPLTVPTFPVRGDSYPPGLAASSSQPSNVPFPRKVYALLEDAETHGFSHIISWQPGGRSFKLHQPAAFVERIMKNYFAQTKLKSFQRQLNFYGWTLVQMGPYKGGYQHQLFVRGSPELCAQIVRQRASSKATAVSKLPSSNQSGEQHPYATYNSTFLSTMQPIALEETGSLRFEDSQVSALLALAHAPGHGMVPRESAARSSSCGPPPRNQPEEQRPSDEKSFPFKLHILLDNAELHNYSHIVSWVKNGRAFRVHDAQAFVRDVMPMYFDQSKYESFRRQLNLYKFHRISKGKDRGIISHPSFVQGARWLCEDLKKDRFQKGRDLANP